MGEKKNGDSDAGKKTEDNTVAVFKMDMHCEGCANKFRKSVREFQGVEKVRADWESNKLTIVGKFDPSKLREKLVEITKKKIEIVSSENKKSDKDSSTKKPEEKKPKEKETPVTTATLKVELHCQGCIEKIYKVVSKTKGVEDMSIERQKDLVIVKGKMDVKALIQNLEEKLKRKVGIVEPKKDKEKEGGEKNKSGGDGGGKTESGGGGTVEGNRLDYVAVPVTGYGYGYGYGYGAGQGGYVGGEYLPSPQIFSDENPNACSVM